MAAPSLKGVLLDIDGTLIDSNDAHAAAFTRAFAEHGLDIPFDHVRPLVGMGSDKLIPSLTGFEHDTREGKAIVERKKGIFEERYLPQLKPTNGARALLKRLLADGLRLVVATSAGGDEMKGLLKQARIDDLIHDATSSGDVDNSKPDPDVIGAATKKSKLKPRELLMVGDTPYDIEAAAKAGIRTIALRCGGWWDDDALGEAMAVYEDPADLLAHWPIVSNTGGRAKRSEGRKTAKR
ncbi:MAG TPA: HAD family hydrolase [Gemmatimonadaceae bacterium]|nr:HAD family hydrolase [Gemmatimonadaceae bacterium]